MNISHNWKFCTAYPASYRHECAFCKAKQQFNTSHHRTLLGAIYCNFCQLSTCLTTLHCYLNINNYNIGAASSPCSGFQPFIITHCNTPVSSLHDWFQQTDMRSLGWLSFSLLMYFMLPSVYILLKAHFKTAHAF
jgi:hypothetical protein